MKQINDYNMKTLYNKKITSIMCLKINYVLKNKFQLSIVYYILVFLYLVCFFIFFHISLVFLYSGSIEFKSAP